MGTSWAILGVSWAVGPLGGTLAGSSHEPSGKVIVHSSFTIWMALTRATQRKRTPPNAEAQSLAVQRRTGVISTGKKRQMFVATVDLISATGPKV